MSAKSGGVLNSNFSTISQENADGEDEIVDGELGFIHGDNDSEMISPSLDTETNLNHIKLKIQNIGPETNAHLREIYKSQKDSFSDIKKEE